MEVGDTTESGDPALFYRLPIFWPIVKRRPEFPRFYRQLIALRKAHPALTRGAVEWLGNSASARVVSFARRDDSEEVVVVINFSNTPLGVTVVTPAPDAPFTDITPDAREPLRADATEDERAARVRPTRLPSFSLEAWGYRIFRRQK
jgi:glycosidase